MQTQFKGIRRGLVLSALIAGAALAAPTARADGCPKDALRPDGNGTGQPRSAEPAKGVTDDVLASIDLAQEPANVPGRLLRLRRLTIAPGGVVPWHDHANRPAVIYIISGEITDASTCAVPIVHHAGETTAEMHTTSHWWKNTGTETVVLLSADLFPVASGDKHMM